MANYAPNIALLGDIFYWYYLDIYGYRRLKFRLYFPVAKELNLSRHDGTVKSCWIDVSCRLRARSPGATRYSAQTMFGVSTRGAQSL